MKTCYLEEGDRTGRYGSGHSHLARERASKVGSIKLSEGLLTPRHFPELCEATSVRDAWGVHCSECSTKLSTGTPSTYDKKVEEISRAHEKESYLWRKK